MVGSLENSDSSDAHSMLLSAARKYLASKVRPQSGRVDNIFGYSSPIADTGPDATTRSYSSPVADTGPDVTSRSRSQPRSRPRQQQNEKAGKSARSKSQPRSRPLGGRRSPDRQEGAARQSSPFMSPLRPRDSRKENMESSRMERARRSTTPEHSSRSKSRQSPSREGSVHLVICGANMLHAAIAPRNTTFFALDFRKAGPDAQTMLHGKRRALHEILQSINGSRIHHKEFIKYAQPVSGHGKQNLDAEQGNLRNKGLADICTIAFVCWSRCIVTLEDCQVHIPWSDRKGHCRL